jgi:hypothetical protein
MVTLTRNRRRSRTYDVQNTDNLAEVLTGIEETAEAAETAAAAALAAADLAQTAAEDAVTAAEEAKDRANHTGQQVAATISDFEAAVDARIALSGGTDVARPDPRSSTSGRRQGPAWLLS